MMQHMNRWSRSHMMAMLDQLDSIDVSVLPNYRMMVLLRNAMVEKGLPVELAERMVSKMEISVSATAFEDEELIDRCVESISSVVIRMNGQISKDFNIKSDEVLESMSKQFTLTLE